MRTIAELSKCLDCCLGLENAELVSFAEFRFEAAKNDDLSEVKLLVIPALLTRQG